MFLYIPKKGHPHKNKKNTTYITFSSLRWSPEMASPDVQLTSLDHIGTQAGQLDITNCLSHLSMVFQIGRSTSGCFVFRLTRPHDASSRLSHHPQKLQGGRSIRGPAGNPICFTGWLAFDVADGLLAAHAWRQAQQLERRDRRPAQWLHVKAEGPLRHGTRKPTGNRLPLGVGPKCLTNDKYKDTYKASQKPFIACPKKCARFPSKSGCFAEKGNAPPANRNGFLAAFLSAPSKRRSGRSVSYFGTFASTAKTPCLTKIESIHAASPHHLRRLPQPKHISTLSPF